MKKYKNTNQPTNPSLALYLCGFPPGSVVREASASLFSCEHIYITMLLNLADEHDFA